MSISFRDAIKGTKLKEELPKWEVCSKCNGSGSINSTVCSICKGNHYIKKIKKVSITVPEGTSDGDRVKLPGYGSKGVNGGESGDKYVVISIQPHKYFKRDGLDVFFDFPVSFLDIIKENTVVVPTPYNTTKIKMKSSYQTGKVLKLPNKGVKKGLLTGNLKITLRIVMPVFTKQEYEEMAELLEPYEDSINKELIDDVKNHN